MIARVATRLPATKAPNAQGESLLPFPIPEPDTAVAAVLAAV